MNSNTSRYLLAYLLWFVSIVLAFVNLLKWRSSAMIILGITSWDRYLEHALNQFGFLFLAILGLIIIVFTEFYYRTGVEKNQLFRRFFLITLIELILLTLADLAYVVGSIVLNFFASQSLIILIVELLLCGVVFVLYRRTPPPMELSN
ncbi:MAG: hypothetical protein KDE50_07755 [Caldilineaceae bacterium]|nr:hypothetical protein [Caldilineaceae bacterium]MCB0139783.1 hypothetical protein [Caldilineaceae bacterium]MCB9148082.1 hypothetical protein [Caldilineaceae bacterium]